MHHAPVKRYSPGTYRLIALTVCAVIGMMAFKPLITGLTCVGVAVALLLNQLMSAFDLPGKSNIWMSVLPVYVLLFLTLFAQPSHALFDSIETSVNTVLGGTGVNTAAVALIFVIIELFIVFVLIGAVAFAVYQGSQSNDVRPLVFAILFIIGGVMAIEIGSTLLLT